MKRKPAQSEDQHQAENDFSYFSPLLEVLGQRDLQTFFLMLEHLAGHEAVENGRAGQRDAEVETKTPPVL